MRYIATIYRMTQPMPYRLLAIAMLILPLKALTAESRQVEGYQSVKLLYQDNFQGDLAKWVVEQQPGGTSKIKQGKLAVNDKKGCTIWFKEKLSAPVLIEWEVTMIKAGGPNDRLSDLNCFAMAIDPKNPDLFAGSKKRGGKFANYHPLRLYYVGYGANNNKTARFRRYPGGGKRPVLPEHDLKASHIPNQKRVIQILVADGRYLFRVDDKTVFDYADKAPFTSGWFAFRTVRNHMHIDNFKVWAIKKQ